MKVFQVSDIMNTFFQSCVINDLNSDEKLSFHCRVLMIKCLSSAVLFIFIL